MEVGTHVSLYHPHWLPQQSVYLFTLPKVYKAKKRERKKNKYPHSREKQLLNALLKKKKVELSKINLVQAKGLFRQLNIFHSFKRKRN